MESKTDFIHVFHKEDIENVSKTKICVEIKTLSKSHKLYSTEIKIARDIE